MRFLRLVCLLAAFAGPPLSAQVVFEAGDAGETLSAYQALTGSGALTHIHGSIATSDDADLFRISISDPALFSATVGGTLGDPQIFLFRLDGTGILGNDDDAVLGSLNATLPLAHANLTALTAGDYLLAVSGYDRDPFDFLERALFTDLFPGVNLPETAGPLDHWIGGGNSGDYTVTLTGAALTAVPEPATSAAAAALGALAFAAWRRRRTAR